MIVLDTNVVSEPLRSKPDAAVLSWLDRQAAETLYLTTTSLAELLFGVATLPGGKRRNGLDATLSELIDGLFASRILAFDATAARHYARIMMQARSQGRAIAFADGQIAAIAMAHDFAIATRDVLPFEAAGLQVINPWNTSAAT